MDMSCRSASLDHHASAAHNGVWNDMKEPTCTMQLHNQQACTTAGSYLWCEADVLQVVTQLAMLLERSKSPDAWQHLAALHQPVMHGRTFRHEHMSIASTAALQGVCLALTCIVHELVTPAHQHCLSEHLAELTRSLQVWLAHE